MQTAPQIAGTNAPRPTAGSVFGLRVRIGWLTSMVLVSALIPVVTATAAPDRSLELPFMVVAETPGCAAGAEPAPAATAIRSMR